MVDKQQNLADNFDQFADSLDPADISFQIGIISTDARGKTAGQFLGIPSIVKSDISGFQNQFKSNIQVGVGGRAMEEGIAAITRLLDKDNISKNYPEFLRSDAGLFIVFVSDEDDKSPGRIPVYAKMILSSKGKGNEETIKVGAIMGPPEGDPKNKEKDSEVGCKDENGVAAEKGTRYKELIDLINPKIQVIGSICDEDFSQQLSKLGLAFSGLTTKFTLSKAVKGNKIQTIYYEYPCLYSDKVKKLGCRKTENRCNAQSKDDEYKIICTPDNTEPGSISYDKDSNTVIFSGKAIPRPKARVIIKYEVN